tara:strand:- start:42 stop:224 length:183 start_codon:yes stop_codon:yes gene_type:complete
MRHVERSTFRIPREDEDGEEVEEVVESEARGEPAVDATERSGTVVEVTPIKRSPAERISR